MSAISIRLIVSTTSVHKITFVKEDSWNLGDCLIEIIKQAQQKHIDLPSQFQLLYYDTDFNDFFSVTSDEQVANLATLKVVPEDSSSPSASVNQATSSNSDVTSSTIRSSGQIPVPFILPQFPASVNLVLDKAQQSFTSSGVAADLPVGVKSKVLDALAEDILRWKLYPTDKEFENVAKSLVETYPCLKSKTGVEGWEVWKSSLKFKMGNLRGKMRQAGSLEALVNSGKRSKYKANLPGPTANLKKPRRGEANYLPDLPLGSTEDRMDGMRKELQELVLTGANEGRISVLMANTFAARRKMILDRPYAVTVKQEWPALFQKNQVFAEFIRITNVNLPHVFYAELDVILPKLIKWFQQRGGKFATFIRSRHEEMLAGQVDSIAAQREFVMKCLPAYLGEKPEELFIMHEDGVGNDDITSAAGYQHLAVIGGHRIVLVVEQGILMEGDDFCEMLLMFFAMHYILDLQYRAAIKSTMEFIQKILIKLGGDTMSSKLQNIRDKLAN